MGDAIRSLCKSGTGADLSHVAAALTATSAPRQVDELTGAHSAQQAAAAEQRERADALQAQLTAALAEATAAVERASESEAAMRDKVQRLDRLEGGSRCRLPS